MNLKKQLEEVGKQIGEGVKVEGLLKKEGRLKPNAQTAQDVLGFDNIVRCENTCFEYYKANPPLMGMTQPVPVQCPVGIAIIDEYNIDYQEAIDIFHTGNWGSAFGSMILSKPVYPNAAPCWHMVSNLGQDVVINANTGKIIYPER